MSAPDDLERQFTTPAPAERGPTLLTVRPRRIVIYAAIASAFILGSMVTVGILLKFEESKGVTFRLADQLGLIGIGLIFAAIIMLAALRPLLKVDAAGVTVRNPIGGIRLPWALIQRVSFPEGAQWAQLELADDETYSVMAIQAMDRRRAVAAMRRFRELFDTYAVPATTDPAPPADGRQASAPVIEPVDDPADPPGPRPIPDRPLGRLELDDLRRAGQKGRRR